MKHILVPTDFSDNSRRAVDFAASLAEKTGASLFLLHALIPGSSRLMEKRAAAKMGVIKRKLKIVYGQKLNYSILISEGKLNKVIETIEKEKKIDFIVMGTKGVSNLRKAIFGSNTEKMMTAATCPLLAIPGDYMVKQVMNMAYATDYSSPEIPIVKGIAKLAALFGANLMLVHIMGKAENNPSARGKAYVAGIKKKINYEKLSYHFIKSNDIIEGISYFINENKIDIISLATHKKQKINKFLTESITQTMLKDSPVPLLVYHK